MLDYKKFAPSKRAAFAGVGIQIEISAVHPLLMPFQRDIVRWACAKGRCAVFADTGLGNRPVWLEGDPDLYRYYPAGHRLAALPGNQGETR